MKILMVCLGNICRSPLAEGVLQEKAKKAGLNWVIDSAGTNGQTELISGGRFPGDLPKMILIIMIRFTSWLPMLL